MNLVYIRIQNGSLRIADYVVVMLMPILSCLNEETIFDQKGDLAQQ